MKIIKLSRKNTNIMIMKNEESTTKCCHCKEHILRKKPALFLARPDYPGHVGIHINCIEDFAKAIVKFRKENLKDIIMEELTEPLRRR